MKLAGVLLIVSIAVCVVSCEKPTKIWGEVEGYELIGTGEANTGYSPNQITMRAVKLPKKSSTKSNFIIHGFEHYDFDSHPSNVSIVAGGLGQKRINLRVLSARGHGINSQFRFFGKFIETKPKH